MTHLTILFYILIYFYGSIPFGLILTKIFANEDIRKKGSGNIGFSNVLRTQKKYIAILTIIADVSKVLLPFYIIKQLNLDISVLNIGIFAFIGHVFSIFLQFKGGKGIAVLFPIVLLINIYLGLIAIFSWILMTKTIKIPAISSLATFIPVFLILLSLDAKNIFYYLFFQIIILWTHRENLKNLPKYRI